MKSMKIHIFVGILSLFTAISYAANPIESVYSDSIDCKAVKAAYEMAIQYFSDKRQATFSAPYHSYIFRISAQPIQGRMQQRKLV